MRLLPHQQQFIGPHLLRVASILTLFMLVAKLYFLDDYPEDSQNVLKAENSCIRPNATQSDTPAALEWDRHDQVHFKQILRAECPYYGTRNGLFHPDTPHPRYLITGGAGFIGSHLVKALRDSGIPSSQVKVVDNLWRGRLANLQYENGSWALNTTADFCALDLRNSDDTMKFIRGADYVYHLADIVAGVEYVFDHQESVFHDNILINTHTLKAAKTNGVPNYIYVGTACSFPKGLQDGPGIHALREDQTYPAEPESAYGWSKLMGEYEAQLAMERGAFNVGLLRFHNVYGPHSDYSNISSQAIPSLVRKAINFPLERYVVWGSGKQYRDFVYITDVVRALLLVKGRGMNRGVIQIGSKHATTVKELALKVADTVGKRQNKTIEVEFDTCKPEGDQGRIAGGDKAKHILDWEAEVSLDEGLAKTIQWLERVSQKDKPSVLIILIGQARGSNYAWKSMLHHLVSPAEAHLATFFTDSSQSTILQQHAQYNWVVPEADDWGIYLAQAAALCGYGTDADANRWRSLCNIKDQWMGGVKGCDHPASSGILLAFRWLVAQKLLSLNLLRQYDYFVMSRPDFLYLCDHKPFSDFSRHIGYVPLGEEYGGYTDRHLVGSPELFFRMINITQQLVCNVDHFTDVLVQRNGSLNLETAQKMIWEDLSIPVNQFDRSFFAVKLPEDPTRWSRGVENEVISQFDNLQVKYPGELDQSMQSCGVEDPALLKEKMVSIQHLDSDGI